MKNREELSKELSEKKIAALVSTYDLVDFCKALKEENISLRGDITALSEELGASPRFTRLSQVSRKFNMPRPRVYEIICNYKHPLKPISPNLKVSDEQIAYLKGYIRANSEIDDPELVIPSPKEEEHIFVTKEELKEQLDSYFNIGL